jgi:large conductance mechanosensitive channel
MKTPPVRGFFSEFKAFAIKGNVVDLAVGVIIGGAFGKIVSSLVTDIVTPFLSLLTGNVDFEHLALTIRPATLNSMGSTTAQAVKITYGVFLQNTFDFVITAFAIFLMIKVIARLRNKEKVAPSAPPEKSAEEKLLEEIRDILKKNN